MSRILLSPLAISIFTWTMTFSGSLWMLFIFISTYRQLTVQLKRARQMKLE